MDYVDRIGLEHPVVQAGMGGGVAGGALAGAVSAAGGLGTVGIMAPGAFGHALDVARQRAPGRPVAANLLVPFVRPAHIAACARARVALVVLHGALSRRWIAALSREAIPVFCSVGTRAEAVTAIDRGADGLVVQGIEAGGHLVGTRPLAEALPGVLEVAGGRPVLAAGGVADAEDVRRLLAAGATAAVAGTRFLLADESNAHPEYQRRVLAADRTLRTLLFGFGWPLPHRVVPNAATERWCAGEELGPGWVRRIGRLSAPAGRLLPLTALDPIVRRQRAGLGLFTPALPLRGMPDDSVDRTALYAGETVHRLHDVIPAAEAVRRLTPAQR